ncbi:glycine cleavage system aminomethyltransferase GcvT [Salinisphaera sp.]|uniref:glycine cleavage system aminomethyltransferase GcvT n=1 Tax=Salinisphaera sp. TaxID=1914330 RepID=UPI002D77A0B0|nr:glycine cleavage system aminomethyltransferase GcvT [Salinisphaera sp.]HET7314902.1 glycine cleavage system aminomethyltransferase GcvT [Salinisphaera sp.]
MTNQTPLHDEHVASGAKLVDFAGWDMPIHYGSQIAEHNTVREAAGMFDVSHMRPVDIEGAGARDLLRRTLANDAAKIDEIGRAFYTCMLNTRGGVIDDLIVYHLDEHWYRIVVNAATATKDMAWLTSQAEEYEASVTARDDLAIIAVQGPRARELSRGVLDDDLAAAAMELKPFRATAAGEWSVGRTGYTGEDGFEIILPADAAAETWRALAKAGVAPIGLGARDTLRLEAGLNLYGQDMDEDTTPLESGLAWTVAFEPADRDFIGRTALEPIREHGGAKKMVGLLLEGRGVMRHGATVRAAGDEAAGATEPAGEVTSGSFAPTLGRSIALTRVPADWGDAAEVEVELRGKWVSARIVGYPFVRNGKIRIDI